MAASKNPKTQSNYIINNFRFVADSGILERFRLLFFDRLALFRASKIGGRSNAVELHCLFSSKTYGVATQSDHGRFAYPRFGRYRTDVFNRGQF